MDRNKYYEEAFKLSRYPAHRYALGENGEGMSLLTAFNAGDIVPLMAEPVLPNDKWDVNMSFLLRMFTPLHQIFSNIYLDTYVFWVNTRLNWTHWMQFCGQNDEEAFSLSFPYTIPKSEFSISGISSPDYETDATYVKSFGCYLGINFTESTASTISGQTFWVEGGVNDYFRRDYLNIYNEWFRDENVIDPILYSKGDTPEDNPVFTYASPLLKAAKFHDYFTDSLPEPMRGEDPIIGGDMPVVGSSDWHSVGDQGYKMSDFAGSNDGVWDLKLNNGAVAFGDNGTSQAINVSYSNLIAKVGITIDDIRRASVVKHVLEDLTYSGTRYPEYLNGLWDASSPEVVLQIPEYVAGRRWRINISEVLSNSNTVSEDGASGSPIGATGAMSKTGASGKLFRKAFSEYGHIYVLAVLRVKQTYFQGIDRKFTDDSFWDLPLPQLSGLGMQPRYKRELVAKDTGDPNATDAPIFGYGPSFDHWRRFPDKAVGVMRPDGQYGLRHWNASEILSDTVSLNKEFIEQPVSGLDRCIAVPSDVRGAFQFYGEFLFTGSVTRTLPGSAPGIKRL